MSLVTMHNDSLFDVLVQFIQTIGRKISNFIEFVVPVGFVTTVSYAFHRVHEYRSKKSANLELISSLKREPRFENFKCVREYSIISHKYMLSSLLHAADRSCQTSYALRCIDIVVRCPQLMNVKCFPHGFTAFHYVCYRGHESLITFMLAKGADASIATEKGETALCMAVYHFLNEPHKNDFSCLDILIRAGSGFGIEDKLYDTLLKMAFARNHKKLIEWLILATSNKIPRSVTSPVMSF